MTVRCVVMRFKSFSVRQPSALVLSAFSRNILQRQTR